MGLGLCLKAIKTGKNIKAKRQAGNVKHAIQKGVADCRGAMELINHMKSTQAGQTAGQIMGNVAALKDSLAEQAKQYNIQVGYLL